MKAQPIAEALFAGSTQIDHMRKVVETVFGLIFNSLNPIEFDFSNLNELIKTPGNFWKVQGTPEIGLVYFELGGFDGIKIRKLIIENPDLKKLGSAQIFEIYNNLDGLIERLAQKIPGFKKRYDFFLMVSHSPGVDSAEGTRVLD